MTADSGAYRPTWRDNIAAHLVDLVLLVGTARFRRLVRSGAMAALAEASREPLEPAPTLNPDFFASGEEQS